MTTYIVRYYWTGSYCSGWADSRPFETLDEASKFASRLKKDEPWEIVERSERIVIRSV